VERRERPQLLDGRDNAVVDQRGLAEASTSVDDAVADGVGSDVVVDGLRLAALDEVALEARRAGVDNERLQRPSQQGGYSPRISST
jgi:hypothetical protein